MCDSKKACCPRPLAGGLFCCANSLLAAPKACLIASFAGYTLIMLWIKALHIVFIASWFAGLFYLPRIYVNLAMVDPGSVAERDRLLLMARKLYRFMSILAVPALVFGLWLWLFYGIGLGAGHGWMHAKLLIVLALLAYHYSCWVVLRKFEKGQMQRSHVWFRWFNEAPVIMMLGAVVLVVVKPF
jgi:putative membrane protein